MSRTDDPLPPSLRLDREGAVVLITLSRASKRNALDDSTVRALGTFFAAPPSWAGAAVLAADGDHFSAGLDLSQLAELDAFEGMRHSRMWHEALEHIEFGRLPVVAALKGAVVGGGLELAASTHVRVAEDSTFFALPEGTRGLFVGGGASVRVPRLIGAHRMADMMLTGRVVDAAEGLQAGLVQYRVGEGEGLDRALALATRIASNSQVTNFAVIQALPRIAQAPTETGFFLESLMAGMAQSSPEAKTLMSDFLVGRGARVDAAEGHR